PAIYEARAGRQSQDCQGLGPHNPAGGVSAGGRGAAARRLLLSTQPRFTAIQQRLAHVVLPLVARARPRCEVGEIFDPVPKRRVNVTLGSSKLRHEPPDAACGPNTIQTPRGMEALAIAPAGAVAQFRGRTRSPDPTALPKYQKASHRASRWR